jgi:hypothetical protein
VVLAIVAVGMFTGAFGGERSADDDSALSEQEEALAAVVPEALRPSCEGGQDLLPGATASLECTSGPYSVTYSRFASSDPMQERFDAFAAGAEGAAGAGTDCARDPSARHEYTVNGQARGEVACYVEEGTSPGTTESVIVWTDDELVVLGRALRRDPADLTLYEWWRTETGPWTAGASPPKDGASPDTIEGIFETPGSPRTLTFSSGRYQESEFAVYGDAALLYGKPSTVLMLHETPAPTFDGGVCPRYEVYRWRLRGDRLSLRLETGGCREYASRDITGARWTRVE